MTTVTCSRCTQPMMDADAPCASCGAEAAVSESPMLNVAELTALRQALAGDFDIAGELGRGGMATVYLAHDITLDRKVAIKVMSRAVMHGGGSERFRREARTAAALSHPNIIPIYTVKQVDDLLFFVMKFVSGRPLDSIIAEVGPLPIAMVQAVLAQVAGALGYAHRQGVVHRDVKPANIIIDDEGWAVVTDFGIARVADASGLTTAGTTVGTPNYVSPEQCLADTEITGASDQYALGVLAYEMLTGSTPFAGKSTLAMMYSHVHDAPTKLLERRPDCPPDLAALVERMLAKSPSDRWPSLDEAITALGAVPMSYDDPTRSQMIAFAKTGSQQQLSALLRTPRSPIPVMRRPTPGPGQVDALPAPSRASGNFARAGVAAAVIVAAAIYFAPWRQRSEAALQPDSSVAAVPVAVAPPTVTAAPAAPVATPAAPVAGATPKSAAVTTPKGLRASAPAESGAPAPVPAAPRETPSAVVVLDMPDEPAAPSSSGITGASALGVTTGSADAGPNREVVTRTITSYADALAYGDLPSAQRIFPSMTADEAARLGEFFSTGGRMKLRWRVVGVAAAKGGATAHLVGTSTEIPAAGASSSKTVDATVGLVLAKGAWKIRDFPN